MSHKHKALLSIVVLGLFAVLLHIVFSENGFMDLIQRRQEKECLVKKNDEIRRINVSLFREIERLNNDPDYLEEVVRKESKMIRPEEIIVRQINEQNGDR